METLSAGPVTGPLAKPRGFWIERLNPQGDVLSRHRIDADTAVIGRGYECDLVLDDPQVAARHLQVSRTLDGRLQVADLGSRNGLWIGRRPQRIVGAPIDGDTPLRIGGSWLRLRETSYPVAAESAVGERRGMALPALLAIAVIAVELSGRWLSQTTEPQFIGYLSPTLMLLAVALLWSGGWALVCRLLSGEVRFRTHLMIGFGGPLVLALLDHALILGGYAFSLAGLQHVDSFASILVFGAMCWLHLRVIGPNRLRLKSAVVGSTALAVAALILVQRHETHRHEGNIGGLHKLMPPAFNVATPQDEDRFFADSAALKPALERRRTAPLPETGGGFNFLDDDD